MLDMGNKSNPKTILDCIALFNESPMQFYLTGSRFFGDQVSKSDFDFFTEDTPEVRTFLTNHGFNKIIVLTYAPSLIEGRATWENRPHPEAINTHNIQEVWGKTPILIHVQLVKDAVLKQEIQEVLKKHIHFYLLMKDRMGRDFMKQAWNVFYDLSEISQKSDKIESLVENAMDKAIEKREALSLSPEEKQTIKADILDLLS